MSVTAINDLSTLEQLGAEARARGEGVLANPFLKHEAMPEKTGEDVVDWGSKMQAWAKGWRNAQGRPL